MRQLPTITAIILAAVATIAVPKAMYAGDYFNGFETDTDNWFDLTRVPTGTDGVNSASGSFHAISDTDPNPFTRWGGYNDDPACALGGTCVGSFPADGYDTSIDIYLDVDGGFANDTRFDFDSAVYQPDGSFLKDFIFNCGFYNDDTNSGGNGTPGAGPNRFLCSASNNSQPGSAYAKNPDKGPTVVATTSGWYTFLHQFRNDGAGVLKVDLSVLNAGGTVIHTWTLTNPADVIGSTVGGNGYGWFAYNQLGTLALDNARRTGVVANGPSFSCVGAATALFELPLNTDVSVKKANRVLSLRMALIDGDGLPLAGYDLTAPPVVQVTYEGGSYTGDANLLSLDTAGKGDDGNMFVFNDSKWVFNMKTKGLASGVYTITTVSGDPAEYVIDPACSVSLMVQ